MLFLETKGQSGTEVEAKRRACEEWARAVNTHGGFGKWRYEVVYDIKGLAELLGQER
jgi:type III restriction enzyme